MMVIAKPLEIDVGDCRAAPASNGPSIGLRAVAGGMPVRDSCAIPRERQPLRVDVSLATLQRVIECLGSLR